VVRNHHVGLAEALADVRLATGPDGGEAVADDGAELERSATITSLGPALAGRNRIMPQFPHQADCSTAA
jgi:hypothetical protein